MRFFIELIDINGFISCINVYGSEGYYNKMVLLEKLPFTKSSEVFENAIALACRLGSAGFDVYIERRGDNRDNK